MSNSPSRWMSVTDVCNFTRLSRSTLKLRRQGADFPLPVEVGGRILFVRAEIEKWAAAQEKAPRRQRIGAKSGVDRAAA